MFKTSSKSYSFFLEVPVHSHPPSPALHMSPKKLQAAMAWESARQGVWEQCGLCVARKTEVTEYNGMRDGGVSLDSAALCMSLADGTHANLTGPGSVA